MRRLLAFVVLWLMAWTPTARAFRISRWELGTLIGVGTAGADNAGVPVADGWLLQLANRPATSSMKGDPEAQACGEQATG